MKRISAKTIALLLVLALALGLCGLAAAEAAATPASPAPTLAPPEISGSLSGTVVHVEANDIVINMNNGNTILFMLNHLHTTDAKIGDAVTVEYSGNIVDSPEAVSITVTKKAVDGLSISGELVMHDNTRIFVEISSSSVFGFTVSPDTTLSGAVKELNDGDTVKVTYSGDLDSIPHAINIEVLTATTKKPAATNTKDNPTNKRLDGYVTALSDTRLTLHTNSGHNYTFRLVDSTEYPGSYNLEIGAKVRVVYDGYASKGPNAKSVKVLAPPDPSPPSPTYHTTSGTVEAFHGVFLTLTNGEGFNVAGASFSGNSDGQPGDTAKVTYYGEDDGTLRAIKVVFTQQIYYAPSPDIVTGPGPAIGSGVTTDPPIGSGASPNPPIGSGVTLDPPIGSGAAPG